MNPSPYDPITSITIGLDETARTMEAKWGVGRLIRLVSDTTRLAMQRGFDAWREALASRDLDRIQTVATKLRAAWAWMDQEATQLGAAPLAPVVWEASDADGRVYAFVRTMAEAHAVSQDGRELVVWSLEEVVRVLAKHSVVADIKAAFPGAKVERVTQHSEGFAADWVAAEPLIDFLHPEEAAERQAMLHDARVSA